MNGFLRFKAMQMKMEGVDEFLADLTKVYNDAEIIYKRCAYQGAKVLADEVKKGIEGLKVQNGYGTQERPLNGVNGWVKADLRDGMGVPPVGAPVQRAADLGRVQSRLRR